MEVSRGNVNGNGKCYWTYGIQFYLSPMKHKTFVSGMSHTALTMSSISILYIHIIISISTNHRTIQFAIHCDSISGSICDMPGLQGHVINDALILYIVLFLIIKCRCWAFGFLHFFSLRVYYYVFQLLSLNKQKYWMHSYVFQKSLKREMTRNA